MPLTLTLDPYGEQLVAQHLRSGRYHSPEEVVTHALESLSNQPETQQAQSGKTVEEAIAHIRQSRKGTTLDGIKIKDLIQAGRKLTE
jgi:Arc/MetJ-type ribon-helix-helix transcriptional regulator